MFANCFPEAGVYRTRVWLLCQLANSLPLSSKIWALRSKKNIIETRISLLVVLAVRARPFAACSRLFRLFNTKNGRCAPPPYQNASSLILPAKLMIYRENPAKNRRDPLENPYSLTAGQRTTFSVRLHPS
jgi:hypothetical protein